MKKGFRILSLDGGGSKGVYTLGVLKELEKMLGGKLYEHFDLVYGTSTGSIIAANICLGVSIEDIQKKYLNLIPKIMNGLTSLDKSQNLKRETEKEFGNKLFSEFLTNIGIVSMNYDNQRPLIFKNDVRQAHGMKGTFESGFGCTISDAVQASCAAFPLFEVKKVITKNQGAINAIDGGFVANNPTLFALIDAHKAIGTLEDDIKLVSIGVGKFIEKSFNWKYTLLRKFRMAQFAERVLTANSTTNELLVTLLYPKLNSVRINDSFNEPEYGTNMVEVNIDKLNKLSQLGRLSFSKYEKDLRKLLME